MFVGVILFLVFVIFRTGMLFEIFGDVSFLVDDCLFLFDV